MGRQPQPSGNTFLDSLSDASLWGAVRVPDESIPTFFDCVVTLRSDPAIQPKYDALMDSLRAEESTLKRDLLSWEWATMPGRDLVIQSETLFSIQQGINGFLPAPYTQWPDRVRRALYSDWLLIWSVKKDVDPATILSGALFGFTCGEYALREMTRRMKQHIGIYPAVLPLMAEVGDSTKAMEKVTATVRKVGRRHEHQPMTEALSSEDFHEMFSDQMRKIIARQFKDQYPLEIVAEALDGKFDILPQRIQDDLSRRWVLKEQPRRFFEISFSDHKPKQVNSREDDTSLEAVPIQEQYADPESNFVQALEVADLITKCKQIAGQDPKARIGLDFLLREDTQVNLAKKHGVDVRTIRRYAEAAKLDLKRVLNPSSE